MNLPTITDIKIKNSSRNKNSNTILVSTREFDPNTHRIILRVNNKFYDDLKYHIKEVVINQGGSQFQLPGMNESVTIYAQLYDYKNDRIICTKKKDFTKILGSWGLALGDSIMSTQNDYFNLFWNSNRKVIKVNGPFDKDGKLQAEVKPGERYYFTAEPNQKLHPVELLSAKWAYQYDDGNAVLFKNHHETIKNGYSAMDCEFHADPRKIKVFAYFQERNENVMVEFNNFGKAEEITLKNQQVEEQPKESAQEEKPEVENNEESLVWSKKVSPEFCNKVIEICKNLWGEKRKMEMTNGLMAVMNVETWGSFKAHHREGYKSANDDPKKLTIKDFWKDNERKSTRAVGLIQFTQKALEQLGEFVEGSGFDKLNELKVKYAKMGEIKQLDKVQKYFARMKGSIKTPEDIYLAVFAPTGIGKKDDFVLYKRGTQEYTSNESVDIKNIPSKRGNKNDGLITRKEILLRYYKSYEEGKLNKTTISKQEKSHNIKQNKKEDNSSEGKNIEESKNNKKWHDPLDYCQRTKYNYYGEQNIKGGTFGKVRNNETKNHQGIDLFALPGKDNVYACVEGEVVESRYSNTGGNVLTIKVKDPNVLRVRMKEINYKLEYNNSNKGEQKSANNFDIEKEKNIYLRYYHLSKVYVNKTDKKEVTAGAIIGQSGVTGNAGGTRGPHLHFEILNTTSYPKGLPNRMNPAYFIKLQPIKNDIQDEAKKKKHY